MAKQEAKEIKGAGEMFNKDILAEMSRSLKDAADERKARLLKRNVPVVRTLKNALATLTKAELEDIAYNVGATASSKLKKADFIDAIAPVVVAFASHWFVTVVDEQYNAFKHLVDKGGISDEFREDEMRLDYFQNLGLIFGASKGDKLIWYMPDEIIAEFKKIDSEAYRKAVELNTDVLRVATGILFYYGVLNHDELFAAVKKQLKTEIESDGAFNFASFMGVMMTGCCWQYMVKMDEKLAAYYTVINPQATYAAAKERDVTYAKLSYGQVYDAGEENYIEATDAYKSLAQFFMQVYKFDVMQAANAVSQLGIIWQNYENPGAAFEYLTSLGDCPDDKSDQLVALAGQYHQTMRLWMLKGHTPREIMTGKLDPVNDNVVSLAAHRKKHKTGRNDPCPCGSGKKYKNCCLRKSEGTDESGGDKS